MSGTWARRWSIGVAPTNPVTRCRSIRSSTRLGVEPLQQHDCNSRHEVPGRGEAVRVVQAAQGSARAGAAGAAPYDSTAAAVDAPSTYRPGFFIMMTFGTPVDPELQIPHP